MIGGCHGGLQDAQQTEKSSRSREKDEIYASKSRQKVTLVAREGKTKLTT